MIAYLREMLFLLGSDKNKLLLLFSFFAFTSLLDMVGVGLIYPFLTIAMDHDVEKLASIEHALGFINIEANSNQLLILFGCSMFLIFLLKSIASVWVNWKIISFGQKQQIRLRSLLMGHYQGMPYRHFLDRNSSDFIYTIQTLTVQYAAGALTNFLKFLSEIMVITGLVILLMISSGPFIVAVIMLFGVVMLGYDRVLGQRNQIYGKAANVAAVKINQGVSEGAFGFKEIRLLNKEKYFYDVVSENSKIYAKNNLKQTIISTSPRYLIEFMTVGALILFIIGPLAVGHNIATVVPSLGVLGLAAMRLMPSMNILTGNLAKLRYNRDAVRKLYSEVENADLQGRPPQSNSGIIDSYVENKKFLRFKLIGVYYKYLDDSRYILKDVSIDFKRGDIIGIVGTSGSGKTTIIDIITGLLEPMHGRMMYNDTFVSSSQLQKIWAGVLAYIPQDIFLLDDTIERNITLEKECVDRAKLKKAIIESKLCEVVEGLPKKLATSIGENGMQLSGGQRQRVSLARALYHDRQILVLDEATSALDKATEREIIREIDSLKGKKTIIIIAHRLSTLHKCDKIYEIVDGCARVVSKDILLATRVS